MIGFTQVVFERENLLHWSQTSDSTHISYLFPCTTYPCPNMYPSSSTPPAHRPSHRRMVTASETQCYCDRGLKCSFCLAPSCQSGLRVNISSPGKLFLAILSIVSSQMFSACPLNVRLCTHFMMCSHVSVHSSCLH